MLISKRIQKKRHKTYNFGGVVGQKRGQKS
jgi:hypothetical protein